MRGPDLDVVVELEEPLERVQLPCRAFLGVDRKIRAADVADEQTVAGEQEPRHVTARPVLDEEAEVLRPVSGRRKRADANAAQLDRRAVRERLVRVLRTGVMRGPEGGVGRGGEPAVPGDVVGVRVRLEHVREAEPV